MTANGFKSHFFENMTYTVTYNGSRCKGKVNNSEFCIETLCRLLCYKLSYSGDLEGCLLYHVGNLGNIGIGNILQSVVNNTGSRYTHIDNDLPFSNTVEGTSHKGVVLNSITEHNKFCTAEAVSVSCKVCCFLYYFAHKLHRIKVYSRTC